MRALGSGEAWSGSVYICVEGVGREKARAGGAGVQKMNDCHWEHRGILGTDHTEPFLMAHYENLREREGPNGADSQLVGLPLLHPPLNLNMRVYFFPSP